MKRTEEPALAPDRVVDGLVYVNDERPGITRHRRGDGFVYRRPDGKRLADASDLQRIRSLAIPPAYTQVWICTLPLGHLQATGRDARGRKQYRYHPDWRVSRDAQKFDRMIDFAGALPRIRARVQRDLALPVGQQVARETVLATIVRLLDTTLVRVGNVEYARTNGSFGLTTLRNRHAAVKGAQIRLRFRGKSGVEHEAVLDDPRVARVVRRCQTLPGQELFRWLDDAGQSHALDSGDVNDYLREASGGEFTAKDFRTWHGSVHALALAREVGASDIAPAGKRRLMDVLRQVAGKLGNTVAVSRKAYVHPRVLELLERDDDADRTPRRGGSTRARKTGLSADERALVAFLSKKATRPKIAADDHAGLLRASIAAVRRRTGRGGASGAARRAAGVEPAAAARA